MLELKEVFVFIAIYSVVVVGVLINTLQYRDPMKRMASREEEKNAS